MNYVYKNLRWDWEIPSNTTILKEANIKKDWMEVLTLLMLLKQTYCREIIYPNNLPKWTPWNTF